MIYSEINSIRQRASNPMTSAWVEANAGSGKTHLLVSRVLRMLLSGTPASEIVCITYTRVAAAEMRARVLSALMRWVWLPEDALEDALHTLTGAAPTRALCERARTLFAAFTEASPDVRFLTVHAFCQSLLKQFPLEAGTAPYFTVMEEGEAQSRMQEATQRVFMLAARAPGSALAEALGTLAGEAGEKSLHEWVRALLEQHCNQQWRPVPVPPWPAPYRTPEEDIPHLLQAAEALGTPFGNALRTWLTEEAPLWDDYRAVYFTQANTPVKRLFNADGLAEAHVSALNRERARVLAYEEAWREVHVAVHRAALITVGQAVRAEYEAIKRHHALVDFQGLVAATLALLKQPGIAPWVMYRLDGGLTHVLVDEAQDTSREQWELLEFLTQEFFAGQGAREDVRSLFVVGDIKQSIFRFQGAAPDQFAKAREAWKARAEGSAAPWLEVPLQESFRSSTPVLAAVDAVFATPEAGLGAAGESVPVAHTVLRTSAPGRVEFWPLAPAPALAARVAATMQRLLAEGAHPGDMMVLVHTRGGVAHAVQRALRRVGIPTAGADRLKLLESQCVQDMLALTQFALLPGDDFSLACVLKSPLVGISEEALFGLAHGRGAMSLWQRVREANLPVPLLHEALKRVDQLPPYEFYVHLLERMGARLLLVAQLGSVAGEVLDELLEQALLFEHTNPPSLQGFLHWMHTDTMSIKRDMEDAHGAVRIMTVHAAKGLEAPIVFLPDTVQPMRKMSKVQWNEQESAPLWLPETKFDTQATRALRQQKQQEDAAERRRLLYVAMTRARSQLYIGGSLQAGKKKAPETSWYTLAKPVLEAIGTSVETPEGPAWQLEQGGTEEARPARTRALWPEAPAMFHTDAPEERAVRRLAPSHIEMAGVVAPEQAARGARMHRALQALPELPVAARAEACARLLPGDTEAGRQVLALLEDSRFAELFAPGGLAEVPISGRVELEGALQQVQGQVDRLVVTPHEVWVVDYKTTPHPPESVRDVPRAMLAQMEAYRAVLAALYPTRTIRSALVWTATAQLMELPPAGLVPAVVDPTPARAVQ